MTKKETDLLVRLLYFVNFTSEERELPEEFLDSWSDREKERIVNTVKEKGILKGRTDIDISSLKSSLLLYYFTLKLEDGE